MKKHPLAEVFGFPISNMTPEAKRYRQLSYVHIIIRNHLVQKFQQYLH